MIRILQSNKVQSFAIGMILLILILTYMTGMNWGLPSWSGWAPDEVIPKRVLDGIDQAFSGGWNSKYPPFHFYLLTLFYSPLLLLNHWGIIDINNLSHYTILFYINRSVSLVMATATLFFIYLCGREIYDRQSSLWAALMTGLMCPYLYYAKIANLESPYLCWFTLSLWFYLRMLKYQRWRDYLGFAALGTIAICTKDQAYGLYILTPILTWVWFKILYRNYPEASQTIINKVFNGKKIGYSLLFALGLFVIFHNFLFNWEGFTTHLEKTLFGDASISPRYAKNWIGHFQMFWQTLKQGRFVFGWPLWIICCTGTLWAFLKKDKNPLIFFLLIPLISYYLTYITPILYNAVRYLLPCYLLLTFFGAQLLTDFLSYSQKFFKLKVALVTAVFIYTFAYAISVNMLMIHDSRYQVEAWMQNNLPKSTVILGVGDSKYLPRLEPWENVMNLKRPAIDKALILNPDYIILSTSDDRRRVVPGSEADQFFTQLETGTLGYEKIYEHQEFPRWNFLNQDELQYREGSKMKIYSNLTNINPGTLIYQKVKN